MLLHLCAGAHRAASEPENGLRMLVASAQEVRAPIARASGWHNIELFMAEQGNNEQARKLLNEVYSKIVEGLTIPDPPGSKRTF
jgi:hypothetical protein